MQMIREQMPMIGRRFRAGYRLMTTLHLTVLQVECVGRPTFVCFSHLTRKIPGKPSFPSSFPLIRFAHS